MGMHSSEINSDGYLTNLWGSKGPSFLSFLCVTLFAYAMFSMYSRKVEWRQDLEDPLLLDVDVEHAAIRM